MTSKPSGQPNAQYNVQAAPDSLANRATGLMRRKMYAAFLATVQPQPTETLLEVGVTSDQAQDFSNYLVAWYPHKSRITAAGIDDAKFLETLYPGVRYVQADGRSLPFENGSFDIVHSSAVIEHVGNRQQQQAFVAELHRVARRAVCFTTPNRWFPVEVHTSIPLLHWLPAGLYRRILRRIGLPFFADEQNLNLLSRRDLLTLCRRAGIAGARVRGMRLAGFTSNLVTFIAKQR